ncbi:MAG TPA: hypothetical protein DHV17_02675 [Chitinophagaceae bacterium]|nr:hypothetical protein [Chitinophagaceae bacterium]
MKQVLFCFLLCAGLGCGSGKNEQDTDVNEGFRDEAPVANKDTASNRVSATVSDSSVMMQAVSVAGNYKGLLPCSGCPDSEAELELKTDGSFILNRKQAGTDKQVAEKGRYSVNKQMQVTLEGQPEGQNRFLLLAGKLKLLDKQGRLQKGSMARKYGLIKY